jgi:hypothetical protein
LNLAKKENAHPVKNYKVGQFVTLNDTVTVTVAGSRQLQTPSSRDIYKIISVMKEGFSLRLLNLRTQGEVTVLHSRVTYLSLEDINNFELGADDLWETLTKLNVKQRNTFQPGHTKRKFQLIHPVSAEEELEESMGLGEEDTELVEEGNVEELDQQDRDYTEDSPVNENLVGHHYNLRPRKVKINFTTFNLNKLQLNQINFGTQNSILKKKNNYDLKQNLELFRMGDKFQFFANKKAFLLHTSCCMTTECEECIFYNEVKRFVFQENSLLNYEVGFSNFSDTKINKSGKKLSFVKGTKQERKRKHKLRINWNSVQLASWFCVSLIEINHLKM